MLRAWLDSEQARTVSQGALSDTTMTCSTARGPGSGPASTAKCADFPTWCQSVPQYIKRPGELVPSAALHMDSDLIDTCLVF